MSNNPVKGAQYLIEGVKILTQPGIRPFVVIPLLLNIFIFSILFFTLFNAPNWAME